MRLLTPTQRKLIFFSYLEGMCFALMVATSESIALYSFLKKGLGFYQLALVSTLPLFIGSLAQWRIPRMVPNSHLRIAILAAMSTQLLGILCLWNAAIDFSFYLLLGGLCMYWLGGLCSAPLWLDWFASQVDHEGFPRTIANRSGFISLTTLVCYLSVAYYFQFSSQVNFAGIFLIGAGARICSILMQTYNSFVVAPAQGPGLSPRMPLAPESQFEAFNGVDFDKILRVFFLWAGIFKLAVYVSSPFLLPYLVQTRHFTLWDYCLVTGMAFLGRALFLGMWARASVGIMPFLGLQLCGLGISTIPLVYTFTDSVFSAACLEFGSGVFWGGFELCAILMVQNFIKESPRRYIGLQMAIMNASAVVGSLLGSYVLALDVSYHLVFSLSSVLRFSIVVFFIFYLAKWPMLRLTVYGLGGYLSTALSFRPVLAFRLVFPKRRL